MTITSFVPAFKTRAGHDLLRAQPAGVLKFHVVEQRRATGPRYAGSARSGRTSESRAEVCAVHINLGRGIDLRARHFESKQRDERLRFEVELKGGAFCTLGPIGIVSGESGAVTVPKISAVFAFGMQRRGRGEWFRHEFALLGVNRMHHRGRFHPIEVSAAHGAAVARHFEIDRR